jgi:transglutaminase superfamily protein
MTRARALSPAQRWLFLEATVWLGLLRAATLTLPYRQVAALLRLTQSAASDGSPGLAVSPAGRGPGGPGRQPGVTGVTGWALAAAAARTPWHSTCLVQSLAGYVILRRRGVPSVVYLGVAKDPAGEFTAHSWLRCGDVIVTGRGGHQRYSAIAAYGPAPGLPG